MTDNPLFERYGKTVEDGAVLFRENEPGETMYIIQSGEVRIMRTINGKEHVLACLGKGDFFGEMAIVSQTPRTATAIAVGTTELLSFDRPGFEAMIGKNTKIAMRVIDTLCRRLQNANQQMQSLAEQLPGSNEQKE
ncbi:Cyclic nucleotide-binding domain-containing protein [Alkalispirochaeta americana]|uniref:Cyclic nucleotide-binding domain-containing protein n=1 Tax=Alkalispirochaeta americana TaxID=159291 RepID=A0A1N6SBC8_9SPIO|nr:cyclic nucleotide-binding domain-containing protein [Alkalispirochaeta americana]SIQ38369.1 Cyclic nucleotide-binding domain-containing protein [Alkalispirochaeta americana]